MVTPTNGTIILRGVSGKSYALNFYISDVIGATCTFNLNGVAGANSQSFYILPENCVIRDVSLATGPTVMTNLVMQINDQNIGVVLPISTLLTTLNQRAVPQVPLPGNRKFTIIQA